MRIFRSLGKGGVHRDSASARLVRINQALRSSHPQGSGHEDDGPVFNRSDGEASGSVTPAQPDAPDIRRQKAGKCTAAAVSSDSEATSEVVLDKCAVRCAVLCGVCHSDTLPPAFGNTVSAHGTSRTR
jgi:hypothetical protein